jgi:16S rRNA (cytosine967-C5)-methyltransferase
MKPAAPYDPHTLVNQTVEAAKKNRNTQGQANFLNACLRRFLRERDALVLACDGAVADTHGNAVKPEVSKHGLVAKWNHPLWWIELLQRDYPEQWQSILETNNQAAPMAVRVNVQRTSREALLAQWEQVGLTANACWRLWVGVGQGQSGARHSGFCRRAFGRCKILRRSVQRLYYCMGFAR